MFINIFANYPPLHILPLNDIKKHKEVECSCSCKPSIKLENNTFLIIHNLFDKREKYEKLSS